MTVFKLENTNESLSKHHPEGHCFGDVCALHKRTEHSMRQFPQHYREDRGIMERLCSHGIGHPDPDDYRIVTGEDPGIHGCDGCCSGGGPAPKVRHLTLLQGGLSGN